MRSISQMIKHEIRELVPAVIYFFITFNAVGLTKSLMLREYGIKVSTFIGATIGALVVAKVVLIVGILPFMEPFRKIPIVYNVLWKTVLYCLVALLVQMLEDAIPALFKHDSLAQALSEIREPQFWAVQIWLFLLFLVFCAFREIIDVLGPAKAHEIFLGTRAADAGAGV